MNDHEYKGIEYHSEFNQPDRRAAINVKRYLTPTLADHLEPFGERAYHSVQEMFWEDATLLAHEAGYSCVFSEGRSGGWLVPFYQRLGDGRSQFMTWPGQGGSLGYPRYPDMDDIGERSRFRAYQRKIERMLDNVPQSIEVEAVWQYDQALELVV